MSLMRFLKPTIFAVVAAFTNVAFAAVIVIKPPNFAPSLAQYPNIRLRYGTDHGTWTNLARVDAFKKIIPRVIEAATDMTRYSTVAAWCVGLQENFMVEHLGFCDPSAPFDATAMPYQVKNFKIKEIHIWGEADEDVEPGVPEAFNFYVQASYAVVKKGRYPTPLTKHQPSPLLFMHLNVRSNRLSISHPVNSTYVYQK
jgi:hypothetical protein